MSKIKKSVNRIVSAFVCALIVLGSVLSPGLLDLVVKALDEDAPPIKVGFETQSATANESNTVIFTLMLTDLADEDVTVYFHTENRSAIAPNEYTSVKSSAVIRKGQLKTEIAVEAKKVTSFSTTLGQNKYSRCFAVIIDSADGAEVDKAKDTALGYLRASLNIPISLNGTLAYANEYKNLQRATHGDIHNIDGGETWKSWDHGVSLNNQTTRSWVTNYINTGLANAYTTLLVKDFSWDANYTSADPRIILGTQSYISYGNCGRWDPGVLAWWKIDPCYNSFGGRLNGYANELFAWGHNPHDTDDDYWDKVEYECESTAKQIYFYNNAEDWFASNGDLYHSMFYRTDTYGGVLNAGASFYNSASFQDFRLFGMTLKMILVDETAPKLLSSRIDSSSLETTGMLRLVLTFSEPVQASTKNSSINVRFNGSNVNKLFTYAGGNYTDTLYYEWKAEKKTYLSCEFDLEMINSDYICDLAYNVDSYGKISGNRVSSQSQCKAQMEEINYTAPEIGFEAKTSGWSKYHEIDVSTGKVEKGTLYYLWNDSPDDVTDIASYGSNKIDFIQPLTTLSFSGVNGLYYLHVLVISPFGLKQAATYGSVFRFDNAPPEFSANVLRNDLQIKTFSMNFFDTGALGDTPVPGGGGIEKLTMTVSDADGNVLKVYTLYDSLTGEKDSCLILNKDDDDVFTATYKSSLVDLKEDDLPAEETDTVVMPADEKIIDLMNGEKRKDFYFSFTVKDVCGNSVNTRKEKYTYDCREGFDTVFTVGGSLEKDEDISEVSVYDIGAAETTSVTVSCDQEDGYLRLLVYSMSESSLEGITYNGAQIESVVNADTAEPKSITLEGLLPGYYELVPFFVMDSEGEEEEVLVSPAITFYVTSARNEETANYKGAYEKDLVLTNKVYQLTDSSFWYLGAVGSNPVSHQYGAVLDPVSGKYEGGSSSPSFSTMSEMRDYVSYMEYQDMYLISISSAVANFLNSGTGSTVYVKADGENTFAQAGQLWIRYKRSSWNTSSNSYGWVFYYYGTGDVSDGIDTRAISTNLRNAVISVRDTICREAKTVYLVGEEHVSADTGAPSLKPSQMHTEREEATLTKMGNVFTVPASYTGDKTLYSNTVKEGGKEYPLATNLIMSVSEETRLYYKYGTKSSEANWKVMDATDGKALHTALSSATGIYTILEADGNGVREYEVYCDTTTPVLKVVLNGEEKTVEAETMQYSGTTFSFGSLMNEIDEYAYVAVYAFNTGLIKNVYYKDELEGVELSGSNYYIEVGDRSGNSFMFILRLASSELTVTTELSSAGNGVIVTVNDRMESEIYRYEVYCNNELISTEFSQRKLYTKSGIYSVFVQDIYGNVYRSETITYNRAAPEVSWFYKNSYDTYSSYNPESIVSMMITGDEEVAGNYFVSTSALLRFRLEEGLGNCLYEISGLEEGDYNVDATGKTVTINKLSGWTLKVWYEEYPENYETYVCIIDDTAPSVDVSYIGVSYMYDEQETLTDTPELIPSTLTYTAGNGSVRRAVSGEIFNGSYITIGATDDFGIRNVSVNVNGKEITEKPEDGIYHLNDYGEYIVTATDIFGNTSVFRFTNTNKRSAVFSIDGGAEGEGGLADIFYGNDKTSVRLYRDAETEILITDGEEKKYYHFKSVNGDIVSGSYAMSASGDEESRLITIWGATPLLSINDSSVRRGQWNTIVSEDDFEIQAIFSEEYEVSLRVVCLENTQDISIRVTAGSGLCPDYIRVILSKKCSEVPVISEEKPVVMNMEGEPVYIGAPFVLGGITDESVTKIEIGYSLTLKFDQFTTVYETGYESIRPFDSTEKGFFCIRITNIYGNVTNYYIRYSDCAAIIVTATYADGTVNEYTSLSKGKTIRSNGTVSCDVYGQNIRFTVNGTEEEGILTNDISRITFYNEGIYEVSIRDITGTVTDYTIVIGTEGADFEFDEKWITGYNEKALRKSEGYTNKVLSAVPDTNKVSMVFVKYGEETAVLYDVLSETPLSDKTALKNSIGNSGNGVYTVGFRNEYGDLVTKEIHYRETSTLILSRITAYSGISEIFDIEKAVNEGIFSSNSITFATEAERYKFTVNKENILLDTPKTYEFTSSSGNGSFEYSILYCDEYGFIHEFKACLLRQTVIISTDGMRMKELDETWYTTGDVFVTFATDETATVSFDGGEAEAYESGKHLYRDGTYRFTVIDKAGNVSTFVIERDSVVSYVFSEVLTEREVLSGGVVNNSAVVFRTSLGDSTFITKVFLDGKEQKDYDTVRFSGTGQWEVMMEDKVGNTAYFSFIILDNAVNKFSYDAPYGYTISEVWWTDKDGNRQLTTKKGSSIELTEDGDYAVIMLSEWDNTAVNFTATVDTTPPEVKLVGCNEGEETARVITLSGLSIGDTVYVYKDGKLEKTLLIETSGDVPSFSAGGKYDIVVKNKAGVETTLTFSKKYIANTATSVLVIIACFAVATGIFVGLLYRNRSKTDE